MIATPTEVGILVSDGNEVLICSGAGFKAGFDDEEYAKAGAPGVSALVCGCSIVGRAAIEVLVNLGCKVTVAGACVRDGFLRRSLTVYKGYLTHEETSGIQNRPWIPPEKILKIENGKLDPAPPATFTRSDNYYEEFDI